MDLFAILASSSPDNLDFCIETVVFIRLGDP